MRYDTLGGSGLSVSVVGLGTASPTFVGHADDKTSMNIIHRALELGINFFDTAETYAEGRAESLLGRSLGKSRSSVVIATKFGKDRSVGPEERPGSRQHLFKAIDGSLRRLSTDYIDLYVFHQPDPVTPLAETLGALDDLVKAGKVRYIGCSGFKAWQLVDALWTSGVRGHASFMSIGTHYNLLDRSAEAELVPCAEAHGIALVPTTPLAGGLLTGKYRRDADFPEGSRFSRIPDQTAKRYQDLERYKQAYAKTNFDVIESLNAIAAGRGRTLVELSIAWLLSRTTVGSVPVGVSTAAQLEAIAASADWVLDAPTQSKISDALSGEGRPGG